MNPNVQNESRSWSDLFCNSDPDPTKTPGSATLNLHPADYWYSYHIWTRTNCPYAATFFGYIFHWTAYIYIYLYKYIYTHIQIYIHIYLHVLLFNFITTFSFRMLCLKKPYNMDFLKKIKTKILIFWYYPKIPLEMNSTHPCYPILIPNTSYVKNFILFVGGSQGVISKIISTRVWTSIFLLSKKRLNQSW